MKKIFEGGGADHRPYRYRYTMLPRSSRAIYRVARQRQRLGVRSFAFGAVDDSHEPTKPYSALVADADLQVLLPPTTATTTTIDVKEEETAVVNSSEIVQEPISEEPKPWMTDPYSEETLESVFDQLAKSASETNIRRRCATSLNKVVQDFLSDKTSRAGDMRTFRSKLLGLYKLKPANKLRDNFVQYMLERKLPESKRRAFKSRDQLAIFLTLARRKSVEIRLGKDEAVNVLGGQKVGEVVPDALLLTDYLVEHCPGPSLNRLTTFLVKFTTDEEWKPQKLKLDKEIGIHYWLVASRLADFFSIPQHPELTVVKGDKIQKQKALWERERQKVVNAMMEIQNLLQKDEEDELLDVDTDSNREEQETSTDQTVDDFLEELEDEEEESPLSNTMTDEEALIESLPQIDRTSDPAPNMAPNARKARRSHYVFEAIPSLDDTNANHDVDPYMVFVDNLPIDVTEEKLRGWYGRCGPIKDIQIFNQRPDLDPGQLSKAKLIERRKRQIRALSKQSAKHWHRPCTPVYALINFDDDRGYRSAVYPALKLFGMICERHQVRSMQATDMVKLYIENLRDGTRCTHMQTILQKVLRDGLTVAKSGKNSNRLIKSCEIRFDTFEEAFVAYQAIKTVHPEGTTLNWFRTPNDAELWWKRELGFD